MITYSKTGKRHQFAMNTDDLSRFSELVWLLKHTPPPVGYCRKPFTSRQQMVIDDLYDLISYPLDYSSQLNERTGQ